MAMVMVAAAAVSRMNMALMTMHLLMRMIVTAAFSCAVCSRVMLVIMLSCSGLARRLARGVSGRWGGLFARGGQNLFMSSRERHAPYYKVNAVPGASLTLGYGAKYSTAALAMSLPSQGTCAPSWVKHAALAGSANAGTA